MDIFDDTVILTDEDGIEREFEFLDVLEYKGEEYVALLDSENDSDSAEEVVILKIEPSDDGDESFVGVKSKSVLNAVYDIFMEKHKDEFNFVD